MFDFVLGLPYRFGLLWVTVLARMVWPSSGSPSDVLLHPTSRFGLAVVIRRPRAVRGTHRAAVR